MMQQHIPLHQMDTHTPPGIAFSYVETMNERGEVMIVSDKCMVHRDDYYLFLFIYAADAFLALDFEEIRIMENMVLYIRPGQVHFVSEIRRIKGWSLAIDPVLVEKSCKNIFESRFHTQQAITLDTSALARMSETAHLLHTVMQTEPTAFSNGIILNLANVFIGTVAEQYAGRKEGVLRRNSRGMRIVHQFKELLSGNFKTVKSPVQYARMLNYSLSHLNESVKNATGFPVSYWIHQQVVTEAKRLLYYTGMDVKEIAFSLGYEDPAYFSRLFLKVTGVSPGTFRRKNHE
ncbi:MAG: helix-turn-helix domain-containing protein [Tannerella sp.]|jgi:AraC-like DNA-binding protein|nr:helix-turn-helix domain-containing protein [Tannerella sp.]